MPVPPLRETSLGRYVVCGENGLRILRTLPILAGRGGKAVVEVPAALVRLFNANGFAVDFICPGSSLPPHDFRISLLEVPALLNEILDPMAGRDSYLTAPPELMAKWARRFGALAEFRLGIAWAGNPGHNNDNDCAIEAALFRPLCDIPGACVFSLQARREDESGRFLGRSVTDIAPAFTDLTDAAVAMIHLDLILSADKSVAHLAGTLGRPIWALMPFTPNWR